MENQPTNPDVIEENLLSGMLSDIKKEKKEELFLNKELLIQLLNLKINQSHQFIQLIGGYSSNTYHYKKENLVLRCPKNYNPLYRHSLVEIHNLSQAELFNLTPLKIVAYYTKYSLLVTKFIPAYLSFSEHDFKNTNKLIALAQLIKKLHYSQAAFKKNPETPLAFIDSSSQTFQKVKSILTAKDCQILQELDAIRDCLEKFKISKRSSHGDCHHFNLIEISGIMQLIDWEVSSIEDPAYDIARFFCVANFNTEQKDIFLQHYKNAFNIKLSKTAFNSLRMRIQLYEPINSFSIVIWAKYARLFYYDDNRKLLEGAIKNFSEKTISTLKKINLVAIHPESYTENRANYPNQYFSLFRVPDNQCRVDTDSLHTNSYSSVKKTTLNSINLSS